MTAGSGFWGQIAASLGGAALQSDAVRSASNTLAGATGSALDEQRRQFDLTRGDFAPWRAAGERALTSLEGDISRMPTAEEVMAEPGYQFGLSEGQRALDRKIAALGGRASGAALKAATRYGTDYATAGYNAAYQRRQDRLNRLASLAGLGQTATGSSAMAGQNSANAISSLISNQGDAAAAARIGQGNIWGNVLNQAGALYGRQTNQNANPNAISAWGLPNYAIAPYGN